MNLNNIQDNLIENFKRDFIDYNLMENLPLLDDVLFAFITGSFVTGVIDDHSDIDLLFITQKYLSNEKEYEIEYYGKKAHWNYETIEFLKHDPSITRILTLAGGYQLYYTEPSELLYVKAGQEKLLQEIFPMFKESGILYAKNLLKQTSHIIMSENIIETKFLYHICMATHVIDQTEYDVNILNEIKRIKYIQISDSAAHYLDDRLKIAQEFLRKLDEETGDENDS